MFGNNELRDKLDSVMNDIIDNEKRQQNLNERLDQIPKDIKHKEHRAKVEEQVGDLYYKSQPLWSKAYDLGGQLGLDHTEVENQVEELWDATYGILA